MIRPGIQKIIWLYKRWQPLYDEIQRRVIPRVEFIQGLPENIESDDFIQPRIRHLVVIDDLATACSKDSRVGDLFTEGSHHRNLSVMMLNQNLYHNKNPTERRNCQYLVLFKNPIDKQAVMTLARQMYPSKTTHFIKKFDEATAKPYNYLLIDLKADTLDRNRLRTDVLGIKETHSSTPFHNLLSQQRDNIKDKQELRLYPSLSTLPIDEMTSCDDCGLMFENVHDLQRHVKKWCPETHMISPAAKDINMEQTQGEPMDTLENDLVPDAELPVYQRIMRQVEDENETIWKNKVSKYMHRDV